MPEIEIHRPPAASPVAFQNAIEVRLAVVAPWSASEISAVDICINAICADAPRVSSLLQNSAGTKDPGRAWHSTCFDVAGTDAEMQPLECEGPMRAGDQTVITPAEGDHRRLPVFFEVYCEIGKASHRR